MTVLEHEREKYRKMWAFPQYRTYSPGEEGVSWFLEHIVSRPGDDLIDLGCGTGRAGRALADKGFNVTLLDFCFEAVDVSGLIFINANLWDLPRELPTFDWIYCADVLEHIPPEFVGATLQNMARITGQGGYLQIATGPDGCGSLIDETLHLTVQPAAWWHTQVSKYWDIVEPNIVEVRLLERAQFIVRRKDA